MYRAVGMEVEGESCRCVFHDVLVQVAFVVVAWILDLIMLRAIFFFCQSSLLAVVILIVDRR